MWQCFPFSFSCWVQIISVFLHCLSYMLKWLYSVFFSKVENRLQRRPRSTSMKDRQNSKAQSDRTSSMESECSPDSRLVAQVNISLTRNVASPSFCSWQMHLLVSVSESLLLVFLQGSQEVCVWPAKPDPHLWWTLAREHHSHQHYRVARTGVFSLNSTSLLTLTVICS